MGLETPEQWRQRDRTAANLVGQSRQTDRYALPGIALSLSVQRLMLAKLFEQHHRQQARARPTAGDDMEWRWRLADLLAVTAAELLLNVLDHLPGFRDHLKRLGNVFAEFGQPHSAAARARHRPRHNHALAGQMLR